MELILAESIESLFERFISDFNNLRCRRGDPFYSPQVIIPNNNLKRWLNLKTAASCGISVNIDYEFLEKGIFDMINGISSGINDEYVLLGYKQHSLDLLLIILSIIIGNKSKHLEPAQNYIKSSTDSETGINFVKLWQLSEKLAFYLREYEYQRKDMIEAWQNEELYCTDGGESASYIKDIEEMEREIYNTIFKDESIRKRLNELTGKIYTTLPVYSGKILNELKNLPPTGPKRDIIFFGFSQISLYHYDIISKLSNFFSIKIYQFNFLPGLKSYFQAGAHIPFSSVNITGGSDQKLLPIDIYKPLKDNMNVLKEYMKRSGMDIPVTFVNENSPSHSAENSLLALQNFIRNNEPPKSAVVQDRSLQIFAAPGKMREIEAVYNSIIDNLTTVEGLKMSDIAILLPDVSSYRMEIESVFGGVGRLVKYNISDTDPCSESIYARAMTALFTLINGNFTRKEVFDLLSNRCFMEKFDISSGELYRWMDICGKLNIFYAYDTGDKKEISYGRSDLFTWKQGLKRMRLGLIMQEGGEPVDGRYYPYTGYDSGTTEIVSKINSIAEELFGFILDIKGAKLTGAGWRERIGYFMDNFLSVPEELAEEAVIMDALKSDIARLELFDSLMNIDSADKTGKDNHVEFDYIKSYIISRLRDLPSGRGGFLQGGVSISALTPMRPIPFKVIYIAGLNESDFPGESDRSILDLRNFREEKSDISKHDSDMYLFTEIVMSCRDKLYLSYNGLDLQKDEELYPSGAVTVILDILNKNILSTDFIVEKIPVQSFSPLYFYDKNHGDNKQHTDIYNLRNPHDKKLAAMLLKNNGAESIAVEWGSVKTADITDFTENIKKNLQKEVKKSSAPAQKKPFNCSSYILAKLIEEPLEAKIKYNLRVDNGRNRETFELKENEKIFIDEENSFEISNLLESAIPILLANGDPSAKGDDFIGEIMNSYRKNELCGNFTESGLISELEQARVRDEMNAYFAMLTGNETFNGVISNSNYYPGIEFARSGRTKKYDELYEPLLIADKNTLVTGSMKNIFYDKTKNIIYFTKFSNKGSADNIKNTIHFYIHYLMLKCAGVVVNDETAFAVMLTGKNKVNIFEGFTAGRKDALKILEDLIDELKCPDYYYLDFSEIIKNSKRREQESFDNYVERTLNMDDNDEHKPFGRKSSPILKIAGYPPVKDYETYISKIDTLYSGLENMALRKNGDGEETEE